ncbi:beta-Ig-H3/fasciclin [Calothrix sp. NIES-4071]|nr:beta-Ig-H3/fasciclin [Calothrix sp. NIES-4071]BAZ57907.1 beta-Ig-H3/fasciclin [Calothrix sp. NIES-4105]
MINKIINPVRIAVAVIGISALSIPVTAQTNQNQQAPTNTQESPTNTPQSPGSTTDTPSNTTQPSTNQRTPTKTPTNTANENLLQVAQSSGTFTTLAQAIEAAGLTNTLSEGSYTIFAPTDQAFSSSLPQGALQLLLEPQNKDLLRQVLSYHVISGRVPASGLKTGSVKTLGGTVAVRKTGQKVIVNNASVTQADIKASNGVIHAVNRVLLPSSLRKTIATKLQQESNPTTQPNQTPAPNQIPETNQEAPTPNQTPESNQVPAPSQTP